MGAKEDCLETLRIDILTLALAPGTDLDESGLTARFGLSRTPLREVLQRLHGEGYVSLVANRGAKVSSMDLSRMRTFFQTAPLVYAGVARMAAEQGRPAALGALKETQRAFRAAAKTGAAGEAALLNHRFHAAIGEMADNPYLAAALGRMLIDHTRLSQTFYRPASDAEEALVAEAADHHDEMIVAFEDRSAEAAIEITLRHWDLSQHQMERFVRPDPLAHDLNRTREAAHDAL